MDWAKTTARGYKKHFSFGIWCDLYQMLYGMSSGHHRPFEILTYTLYNLWARTVPADSLAPLSAWVAADIMMNTFRLSYVRGAAILKVVNRSLTQSMIYRWTYMYSNTEVRITRYKSRLSHGDIWLNIVTCTSRVGVSQLRILSYFLKLSTLA